MEPDPTPRTTPADLAPLPDPADVAITESLAKLARTVDGLKLLAVGTWPFPFHAIESNWNGEGAAEVTADTIQCAHLLYNRDVPKYGAASSVVARPDGSLSVIWHGADCYRQVDVRADLCAHWVEACRGKEVKRWVEKAPGAK